MFAGLQLFRGDFPETRESNAGDIFLTLDAPAEVSTIIRTACYDCHSMETKFPWYSRVAPISWWIIGHIDHGREELNFSEWSNLPKRTKLRKLKELGKEVEKGEMPLPSYLRGHPEARLTEEQRILIRDWSNEASKDLVSTSSKD